MPITQVTISNSALRKIGQERITSMNDATKAARLCKEALPGLIEEVLRDHPWNFAIKRAELNQLVDAPVYGYDFQYQKPVDCLRIWKAEDDDIVFKVEGDVVLTDENTFFCQYISSDVEEDDFTPDFAEAVSFRLAADIAYVMTGSTAVQQAMMAAYLQRVKGSKSNDAQEGYPDDLIETTWDKARF